LAVAVCVPARCALGLTNTYAAPCWKLLAMVWDVALETIVSLEIAAEYSPSSSPRSARLKPSARRACFGLSGRNFSPAHRQHPTLSSVPTWVRVWPYVGCGDLLM
jgi:hypothetical protein